MLYESYELDGVVNDSLTEFVPTYKVATPSPPAPPKYDDTPPAPDVVTPPSSPSKPA